MLELELSPELVLELDWSEVAELSLETELPLLPPPLLVLLFDTELDEHSSMQQPVAGSSTEVQPSIALTQVRRPFMFCGCGQPDDTLLVLASLEKLCELPLEELAELGTLLLALEALLGGGHGESGQLSTICQICSQVVGQS